MVVLEGPATDMKQKLARVINFSPMHFFHIHPLSKNITFMGMVMVFLECDKYHISYRAKKRKCPLFRTVYIRFPALYGGKY